MSAKAIDVANYFLAAHRHEDIDGVRLNLLVVYAQAHALGIGPRLHDDGRLGLFDEDIVASAEGPVAPSVKAWYDGLLAAHKPIRRLMTRDSFAPFDSVEKFVLMASDGYYWEKGADELAEMARREFPGQWGGETIPKEAIYEAFKGHSLTLYCIGGEDEEPEPCISPEVEERVRAVLGF